ncbi:alpha/beta hydrolase [Panacibacter ginsenosidivorans]|uniref:Alpha/beta hydrolase n=1 Tax=Panacibacter ginsenosidivorans TaxID=1813871 RepID=A0A5B8V7N0_9BACT|nr:alpha/beta hydrolase-fold protein [Panacibacter ginsenosidivorans]QEC66811.1 alpha/beta hydrolase [Panacibacter ginsenosidivorans]
MKHFITLCLLLIIIFFSANAQSDNKIIIGKVDSVYSNILGEQRKVWIYTPDMLSGNRDTTQRYPVVYLLDGDGHFESVAGMIQQLSEINGNTICPEMIVVGIPNTDRTRDLTPTHISSDQPMMDSNFSKSTGGGENFVSFIEKELMPHIDSVYPTQPYRTLIGHSFGGLTAMNILTNHTKLFNAYIAIDPSMWYDKERFLAATEKKLTAKKYDGVKLYLGIANTMPEGMTVEKMLKDTTSNTRHIRSIFALDRFIKANAQNGLKFSSKYYADDDHGSVPLISEYDGLRFIFSYYRMKLTIKDFTDSSAAIVAKYKKHYETVSREFGFKVSPPELSINSLGYQALGSKQFSKAAGFFEMNIANYPNSTNVYDSYGDFFASKKDTATAISYYQKALAIKEVDDTRQKLNQMQGKEVFKLSEQELQKYVGVYTFEGITATATFSVKNNALWASVPGEGDFELVPTSPNTFKLKSLEGYKVIFEMDGDKPKGFTSYQPNGTYTATYKKD